MKMYDKLPYGSSVRDKLEAYSLPVTETGCWMWLASCAPDGYGLLYVDKEKTRMAHRLSYEDYVGPIPDGLSVLHHCDVPGCINPDHLYVGTPADNMRDRDIRGRTAHGEGHGSAKLNESDVRQIIQMLDTGTGTHGEIGSVFGVSHAAIRAIQRGRNWKSVTGGKIITRPL